MNKINKITNFLFFTICLIYIMFILLGEVNASQPQNYQIFNGKITGNLCRFLGNDVNNYDLNVTNGTEYISCNFNTGIPFQEIRLFFNTETYWGYTDRFINFSGTAEFGQANATIISASVLNGNGTIIGSCNTNTNSTGQMTAWSSQCWVPTGLNSGNYTNILSLRVASLNNPTNGLTGTLSFSRNIPIYDNYYLSKNGNVDITNAINNQSQQQHQDSINTQNKLNDINNTMNNGSIDDPSSSTSSWNNKNATNGTITNLLTLPIQLMQGYVNGMNSSCSPFNLGNLFGTTIILPCINVGNLIGSSLWSVIDILFSGFMIFGIAKKLIKIFNDFTNMKSNQVDELYGGGA